MKKIFASLFLFLITAGLTHAGDFTLSGFSTIVGGKAYSGYNGDFMNFKCPCFIGNYENGTVYENKKFTFKPESLVGVQGKYAFNEQISATAQVIARAEGDSPQLQWAYASYDISPETTVHVGRRRLPIYAYSDSLYIGYTLPWVRVPQDLYGWEIGSYNGISVTQRGSVGTWAVTGHVFAGQESTTDNRELKRLYYGYRADSAWKNLVGASVEASNDILSGRIVYAQNQIDETQYPPGEPVIKTRNQRQRILGLSGSIDYKNFLVRGEANSFVKPSEDYKSISWSLTTGYKAGDFTPYIGYSSYKEKLTLQYTETQNNTTRFAGVRWDFRKNMDLKIQFDSVKDTSNYDFTHDAKMISIAFDTVF